MYRFVSSRNPIELKKAYLEEYNVRLLQRKLDKLMKTYPEIMDIFPEDITAKKLLIGNFRFLTKVYWAFTTYLSGKCARDRASILKAFVDGGFKYDSHKGDIRRFLMDAANGFEIHNCVYCDLEDITTFAKADGTEMRRFDTEHVLDKGECPLVALSLYNFVPSCVTCNSPAIKGTKTIGDTEEEILKLSPTADSYDFEGKVKFEVKMVTPGVADLKATSHADDYDVEFVVGEATYQKTIDLFELKQRYNHGIVKSELLKWRDRRRYYSDNKVREIANLKMVSFDEMFEDIFELELRRREHYPMEKARRDIMLID